MPETRLRITGMTCGHCVSAVTKALQSIPGVQSVEVSLEQKRGTVQGVADPAQLVAAVKEQGYEAEVLT